MIACIANQVWWGPGLIVLGLVFAALVARLNGEHVGRRRGIASHEHPLSERGAHAPSHVQVREPFPQGHPGWDLEPWMGEGATHG